MHMRPSFYVKNHELVSQSESYPEINLEGTIIYEVIRVINGKVLFFEDHLERFRNSLQMAKLDANQLSENINERIAELIRINKLADGNIKFLVNKDFKENITFYAFEIPHYYPTENEYKEGVKLILFEAERINPSIKQLHSSLKERVDTAIEKSNAFEAILVHPNGYLTEGSKSNFFMIKNSAVYTSPGEDVLLGVTREKLIKILRKNAIPCNEIRIVPTELNTFEAAFLSGTSPKVLPAKAIDKITFDPKHPLLVKIMDLYNTEIESYLKNTVKIL